MYGLHINIQPFCIRNLGLKGFGKGGEPETDPQGHQRTTLMFFSCSFDFVALMGS